MISNLRALTLSALLLGSLLPQISYASDTAPEVATGTVVDAHGLDGCTYLIKLDDGQVLEASVPAKFAVNNLRVQVSYKPVETMSICMAGQTVDLVSIKALNHGSIQPATAIFSRDLRPVDGPLVEVILTKTETGTYDATLRTNIVSIQGQEGDQTKELGLDLECTFAQDAVVCARDDRPVDGSLVELTIRKDAKGTYEATLHTNFYDRIGGHEVDQVKVVASKLTRKA